MASDRKEYFRMYYQTRVKPYRQEMPQVPNRVRYKCPLCGFLVYEGHLLHGGFTPDVLVQTNRWGQGEFLKYRGEVGEDAFVHYRELVQTSMQHIISSFEFDIVDMFPDFEIKDEIEDTPAVEESPNVEDDVYDDDLDDAVDSIQPVSSIHPVSPILPVGGIRAAGSIRPVVSSKRLPKYPLASASRQVYDEMRKVTKKKKARQRKARRDSKPVKLNKAQLNALKVSNNQTIKKVSKAQQARIDVLNAKVVAFAKSQGKAPKGFKSKAIPSGAYIPPTDVIYPARLITLSKPIGLYSVKYIKT